MKFKKIGQLPKFTACDPRSGGSLSSLPGAVKLVNGSQAPTPIVLPNGDIKVYFSSRNDLKQSLPFYYIFDPVTFEIMEKRLVPILSLGSPGEGDDSGVMPSHYLVQENGLHVLLYTGWNNGTGKARYRTCAMKATSMDGVNWQKTGIMLDRSLQAPCGTSMPFLDIKEQDSYGLMDSTLYYMAYTKWENGEPFYDIRGQHRNVFDGSLDMGNPLIPLKDNEGGIARQWKWQDKLFYCYRGQSKYRTEVLESYKIGYAQLEDREWIRKDDITIEGLDSNSLMQAYPALVDLLDGRTFMLFNETFTGQISIAEMIHE